MPWLPTLKFGKFKYHYDRVKTWHLSDNCSTVRGNQISEMSEINILRYHFYEVKFKMTHELS